MALFDEGATTCCYAESEKSWVKDPSGIAWETYHTMAEAQMFSSKKADGTTCCAPKAMPEPKVEAKAASCSAGSGCC
jgi:hypothetical protein